MGIDVYEQIPVMESKKFLLREIEDGDAEDLLKVYSDNLYLRYALTLHSPELLLQ